MTSSRMIDMSKVPVPDIIEVLDYEQKLEELKTLLVSLKPEYASFLKLESEPMLKLLQIAAYRELHLIGCINDATRANILATATGNDLVALASRYNIEPLVVQNADPATVPPTPLIMESDKALRRRVQMAFDGLNTAGSIDSYIYHALGADGQVRDADAYSPAPTEISLTILSYAGDGTASQELIEIVRTHFGLTKDGLSQSGTPSKIRPQGDRVTVRAAQIINYTINAQILVLPGPAQSGVLSLARAALDIYIDGQCALGAGITVSGIHRALHQPGVKNVLIESPSADISVNRDAAAYCTQITLGIDVEDLDE